SPYCDALNLIMRVLGLGLTRAIFVAVQCRRTDQREAPWRWMATGSDREARSIAAWPAALLPPRPFPLLPARSRDLQHKRPAAGNHPVASCGTSPTALHAPSGCALLPRNAQAPWLQGVA